MKKPLMFLAAGAFLGPALMGLLKIAIFAIGLGAIICGGLFLMGDDDDNTDK